MKRGLQVVKRACRPVVARAAGVERRRGVRPVSGVRQAEQPAGDVDAGGILCRTTEPEIFAAEPLLLILKS